MLMNHFWSSVSTLQVYTKELLDINHPPTIFNVGLSHVIIILYLCFLMLKMRLCYHKYLDTRFFLAFMVIGLVSCSDLSFT